MNPSSMLEAVAKVIKDRPFSQSGRYVLYYRDGKVGITPLPASLDSKYVITRVDSITLDKGFTSAEWKRIARKIVQIKHPCPCQGSLNEAAKKPD